METFNLNNMFKGWFIGDFEPTIKNTKDFEFAIKRYNSGDYEKKHHHKISTEYTIIIEGEVEMNGVHYEKDDIIVINPNESTDFNCLTDVITAVVKIPSAKNDKYIDV
jgi:mannose-6-phosphate isomerase-like protein (cupin superfamily)